MNEAREGVGIPAQDQDGEELILVVSAGDRIELTLGDHTISLQACDLEHASAVATQRLARPPWPTHVATLDQGTTPFDVICTVSRRTEAAPVKTKDSVSRMQQAIRANRVLDAGGIAMDLHVHAAIPNVTAATFDIEGVPSNEVTVTSPYWTAHILRALSDDAGSKMNLPR